MKNIGDYTGAPDDVPDRYDYLSGLRDTTGYSQKEWEIIYKHSGVVMEVLLARHRGELPRYWELTPEQRLSKEKAVNFYREATRSERVKRHEQILAIKREKVVKILGLKHLLRELVQLKEKSEEIKSQASAVVVKFRGDTSKMQSLYDKGENDYSGEDIDIIIISIVFHMQKLSMPRQDKSTKRLSERVIIELKNELKTRGFPVDLISISKAYTSISKDKIDSFMATIRDITQRAYTELKRSKA